LRRTSTGAFPCDNFAESANVGRVASDNRERFPRTRGSRLAFVVLIGAVAAATAATLSSGAVAQSGPHLTSISIFVSPNPISIGDAVTVKGNVFEGPLNDLHELLIGANVVVTRYSGPNCTLVATQVASLKTDGSGEYSFTETPPTPPPLSYRILYTGGGGDFDEDDPTGVGEDFGPSLSDCVTVGSTKDLSGAAATGKVTVDGSSFRSGVIDYGSKIEVAPGGTLNLGSSVGHVIVYPTGTSATFIPTRTSIPAPTKKNKNRRRPIIVLRLVGGDFSTCSNVALRSLSAKKPRPKRTLWARGKGNYRTVGNVSSATVSGTSWVTTDTCAGTLTKVLVGVVAVKDFTTGKTVILKAGQSYLAKPPG
jgi:hypothetical protein